MAILDFSVSGWHGFGSVTQVCFGISVSNFMCMSFVAVGRNLTIVNYFAFKMAANGCLVILNNAQLQSTHCPLPPSPMGWGYPSRSLIYNFYLFFCPKPLHEPLFTVCPVDTWQQTTITFNSKYQCFLWWKCILKCHLQKLQPFYSGLVINNYGAKMFLNFFIISMV